MSSTDRASTGWAYLTLRHRDFRLLWATEGISTVGSQIQRAAVAWQIFQMTGDPLKLGILGLCRFVPIILFGIAGGVLADRRDRRQTLLATQFVLLLTSAALAALTFHGSISLYAIYAITIFSATVESGSNPTRQALIPALVPRGDLPGATTMNLLAFHVAAVGGPALGGLLIAWRGIGTAYLVDAVSFLAVIAAVLLMRQRPQIPSLAMGGFAAALEGLRFLRGMPVLLGVMGTDFVATFFGVSNSLMPIFAGNILHAGPQGYGLLLAAPAAGAVATALIMGFIRMPARPGAGVLLSVLVYGACLLGFGLSRSLALSLALLAGSGAADSVSMTLRHGVRNLLTPDALRGRVAAVHRTLGVGGPQLGEFEAGLLASLIGAGPAVALGGMGTMLSAIAIAKRIPAIAAYRLDADPTDATDDPRPAALNA
ncbi:MAG: MFS transporter [Thermomicrobiales bacterium]